jgi:predicted O-methyltransferase YrrM
MKEALSTRKTIKSIRYMQVSFLTQQPVSGPAQKRLREIEAHNQNPYLPIIGPKKGVVLTQAISEFKPKRILEVGTLIGYSAILMGKDLPADAEIVTIEIQPERAEQARKNIQTANIPPKVKVLVGNAKQVIPTLEGCFDMVFIDAGKTEYFRHLQEAEGKLHKGSVVAADNVGVFADRMLDYLDYVRCSGKYRSSFFGFGEDGVEVSVKL